MKLRCINEGGWVSTKHFKRKWPWSKKEPIKSPGPKKGDIVTVESEYYWEGMRFYNLVEWPRTGKERSGFYSKCFEPIDNEQSQYKEVEFSEIKKKTPAPSTN